MSKNRHPNRSRKPRRDKHGKFVAPKQPKTTSTMIEYETAPATEAPRDMPEVLTATGPAIDMNSGALATATVVESLALPSIPMPRMELQPPRAAWYRRVWNWLTGSAI